MLWSATSQSHPVLCIIRLRHSFLLLLPGSLEQQQAWNIEPMSGFLRAHPGQSKLSGIHDQRCTLVCIKKIRDLPHPKPQGKDGRISSRTFGVYELDPSTDSQERSAHIDWTFAKPSPRSVKRHLAVFPGSMAPLTLTTQDYSLRLQRQFLFASCPKPLWCKLHLNYNPLSFPLFSGIFCLFLNSCNEPFKSHLLCIKQTFLPLHSSLFFFLH